MTIDFFNGTVIEVTMMDVAGMALFLGSLILGMLAMAKGGH